MKIALVPAVLACAECVTGCVTDSEPYPVEAVVNLEPMGAEITGPIELLGMPSSDTASRTLAAYHVHLPDAAPRRVRIYDLDVCDPNAPPPPTGGPPNGLRVIADLQQIRRVGDQTHFFMPGVRVADRTVDVDTGTIQAPVSTRASDNGGFVTDYVIGKIAVVQELDRDDGTPGGWLACGVFVEASR